MTSPLAQGLLTGGQKTLSPSTRALGPNVYFGNRIFLIMLGLALALHLGVLVAIGLIKPEQVTDIPVRALSFKIGDNDRIAAYGSAAGVGTTMTAPSAVPASDAGSWRASPLQPVKPREVVKPKPIPIVPQEQRQMPLENRSVLPPLPAPQPAATLPDTPSAIAATPQRYIREVGAAPQAMPLAGTPGVQNNLGNGVATGAIGGQGTTTEMTAATAQAIRERYEQQISDWIELHKLYPAAAQRAEGKTIVRMRIDRSGYVRYYALEETSGNALLDAAAIDMVRRANPVPAVPANYPSGALIEFLVPITFKAPQ